MGLGYHALYGNPFSHIAIDEGFRNPIFLSSKDQNNIRWKILFQITLILLKANLVLEYNPKVQIHRDIKLPEVASKNYKNRWETFFGFCECSLLIF